MALSIGVKNAKGPVFLFLAFCLVALTNGSGHPFLILIACRKCMSESKALDGQRGNGAQSQSPLQLEVSSSQMVAKFSNKPNKDYQQAYLHLNEFRILQFVSSSVRPTLRLAADVTPQFDPHSSPSRRLGITRDLPIDQGFAVGAVDLLR
ncbi:hypothetical protein N431DRAFT_468845 [Stipitochalara longipes BDJ]|nr:hypothetical protein N431DRAFT_468845 [Stipitochalara longipes BDJ]